MEINFATGTFSALAQDMRLSVFRHLVKTGPKGCLAGELAAEFGVLPNTLSANLAVLANAKLVVRRREGRNIRYVANMKTIRHLLGFLMQDCCGGRPELCQPVLDELSLTS